VFYLIFVTMLAAKVTTVYLRQSLNLTIASIVLDFLALLIHLLLTCRDPGFIKNDGIEFMKLLETFDSYSLCPECQIIRTGRSRHCIVCGVCVDRYDHHCPWINNCVGLYNHNMFLLYLIVQQCSIMMTIITNALVMNNHEHFTYKSANIAPFNHHAYFWTLTII
jgi:hypothetical protein